VQYIITDIHSAVTVSEDLNTGQVTVFALLQYIKDIQIFNYTAYPRRRKQFSKTNPKVVMVTFKIVTGYFCLMVLTHSIPTASCSQSNEPHVCTILDTICPTHFHSDISKAHLISHFTADARNVPLVTFNIFNKLITTETLFGKFSTSK
jgi:hypothetical protein